MKKSNALCAVLGTVAVLSASLLSSGQAYALRSENTLQSLRQERGLAAVIRVEGALNCKLAGENDGRPCQLKLIEKGTGKTYELIGANGGAMRLLNDGRANVRIEGTPKSANVISVRVAEAVAGESQP